MIIFNEKQHAIKMIKNGFITPNQEIKDLFILAKYFYYNGFNEDDVKQKLNSFIIKNKNDYSDNIKNQIIDKTTKSGKMGKLVFDKTIHIYENELEAIQSIEDNRLQKLMFVYIVLSKFFNGLFKASRSELFKLANLNVHNRDKPKLIYQLNKTKLTITTIKKGKTLRGVNIKPQGNIVLQFIANEDFILHYLKYIGDEKVINCEVCGKLIYKKSNKTKYCPSCAKEIREVQNREKALRYYHKNKNFTK